MRPGDKNHAKQWLQDQRASNPDFENEQWHETLANYYNDAREEEREMEEEAAGEAAKKAAIAQNEAISANNPKTTEGKPVASNNQQRKK